MVAPEFADEDSDGGLVALVIEWSAEEEPQVSARMNTISPDDGMVILRTENDSDDEATEAILAPTPRWYLQNDEFGL
jgi:hypothetical protein